MVEGLGDELFGVGVEGGGGFVEDEDGGFGEEGSGDSEALALAAGEVGAAFGDFGVEGLGEFLDEIQCAGELGCVGDLRGGGVGAAVRDVFGDGGGEHEVFLEDEGDVFSQVSEADVAEVDAVQRDGSVGGVVKAGEEGKERGLADTG